jgi:hypothetical protein
MEVLPTYQLTPTSLNKSLHLKNTSKAYSAEQNPKPKAYTLLAAWRCLPHNIMLLAACSPIPWVSQSCCVR